MVVIGFSMVIPFLPLYLKDLGVTDTAALTLWSGIIFGITPLMSAISSPLWGVLGDRLGPKPMMNRAQVLGGIMVGLMTFAPGPVWLLVLRALQGLVGANMGPASALTAAIVPQNKVGTALGLFQLSIFVGASIGPFFGGILGEAVGARWTFAITGVLQLLAAVVTYVAVPGTGKVIGPQQRSSFSNDLKVLLTMPALLALTGVSYAVAFSNGGLQAVLTLFIEQLHEGGSVSFVVGLVFAVGAVASAVSAVATGRLGDAVGQRPVLIASLFGAAAFTIPQAFATTSWQLMIGRALTGLCLGGCLPVILTLAARIGGPARRAGAIGIAQSAQSLGLATGPLIGAAAAAFFGLGSAFIVTGIVLAAAGVWAAVAIKITKPVD